MLALVSKWAANGVLFYGTLGVGTIGATAFVVSELQPVVVESSPSAAASSSAQLSASPTARPSAIASPALSASQHVAATPAASIVVEPPEVHLQTPAPPAPQPVPTPDPTARATPAPTPTATPRVVPPSAEASPSCLLVVEVNGELLCVDPP